jgi:L-alanine-DL-glutamate epimerase-like enolase superfamily enzyme
MAVRIIGVDIYPIELRYAHGTYVMSGGRAAAVQQSTLVRVRTDAGVTGWGEACPLGATSLEAFADGIRAALPPLADAVLGSDPRELGVLDPDTLLHASFMNDWVCEHVAGHLPRSAGGRGRAPLAPGLGIEVDVGALGTPLATIGQPG